MTNATGYYAVKKVPTKIDAAQVGAPVGEVITIDTSIGSADEMKGGYVINVTRTETRSIVSHTDTTITLSTTQAGNLGNWVDTDDLDVYDSWSVIQTACNQLYTDQAAVTFTENQYVRIFAGTYVESVEPNVALNPDRLRGFNLIVEGNPTDDRENIIIQGDGVSSRAFYFNGNSIIIRHLKVDTVTNNVQRGIYTYTSCYNAQTEDCIVMGSARDIAIHHMYGNVTDCYVSSGYRCIQIRNGGIAERCTAVNSTTKGTRIGILMNYNGVIRGCTVRGFNYGMHTGGQFSRIEFSNNTVYDCNYGIGIGAAQSEIDISNNIISTTTNAIYTLRDMVPDRDVYMGGRITLRNNCFHSYTDFFANPSLTKTHAEFIAYDGVDADGDLDNTDPIMTNPGAGDFTLQTTSPCHAAAVPAGVIYDNAGDSFRVPRCAIGAFRGNPGISKAHTFIG